MCYGRTPMDTLTDGKKSGQKKIWAEKNLSQIKSKLVHLNHGTGTISDKRYKPGGC